jgi:hypothetical protein
MKHHLRFLLKSLLALLLYGNAVSAAEPGTQSGNARIVFIGDSISAPRDDTARARCGNGTKSDFLSLGVDTVFRKFQLTARQAVQRFGASVLPDRIAAEDKAIKVNAAMYLAISESN